jgi:hypothetical protein
MEEIDFSVAAKTRRGLTERRITALKIRVPVAFDLYK